MLKGLYDFTPINSKTLAFRANENLLYLSAVSKDENWLRVSNCKGQIGLVPINYVDADCHVSGSTILDFLDESIQIARRDKSPFLPELQEIRRNILNPILDLECRLKEFQSIINQLKSKGSPYYNRGKTSRKSSQHTLFDEIPEEDGNSNVPSSFLTCDDSSGQTLRQDAKTPRCTGDDPSDRMSVKSQRSESKSLLQYVNPRYDNESQKGRRSSTGDCSCSARSSDGSETRSAISSRHSSFTYTCPPGIHKTSSARKPLQRAARNAPTVTLDDPEILTESEEGKICELIEAVRQATGASYEVSHKSVQTVLHYLRQQSYGDRESLHLLLQNLEGPVPIHRTDSALRSSADYERLYLILTELSAHAVDDELWEVQNDDSSESLIQEMHNILNGADQCIIIKALEEDEYQNVQNLTLYFQKEHRWSRRQNLIQCFAKMAALDPKTLSILLNSVLPLELAREMTDASKTDKNRLETAGSLLGLLLSSGEKLPVHHLDVLGKDFIIFILNKLDQCSTNDLHEMATVLTNLILAYNLQFGSHDENLTIAALATRQNAKFLTQKIVHLLLWEQDPISLVNMNVKGRQDSVLKLVVEMFACSMTADLFYTNDAKVLIDIVIRSLNNWEPGEKRRTVYLYLIRMIIRNSNFREHNHRRDDLVKIFTAILLEEDPLAVPDQRLIREITNEFPNLIK